MFRHITNFKKALIFYALTLTLAIAVTATAPLIGDAVLPVYMLAPVVAVLILLLIVTRDGYTRAGWADLGLHRFGRQAWAFAILMPLPVLLFSYSIAWSTGIASLVIPSSSGSVLQQIPNFLIGLVVSLFFTLGEEIGWRGYLLPRLMPLGPRRAMLLTGLLHGIYHLPVMLLTPFYHGEGNRFIVLPLFLLTLTLAGLVYGYLRLTTNSVWPAALTHLAFNTYWLNLGAITLAVSPVALEYLAGESGLLTILSMAVVIVWLLVRLPGQLRAVPKLA
jgi:membrane protease YdiL (CAAX protease family)